MRTGGGCGLGEDVEFGKMDRDTILNEMGVVWEKGLVGGESVTQMDCYTVSK